MILVTIYHCYIRYNMKTQNCKAVWARMSILVYPLHWGSIQGEEVWPPICYAVLFFLPVPIKHLMKKPMGVGLVPTPRFLYQIPSSTSESMRTCFTEGGSVWHARNLSDPRPFTARKYSIYTLYISTLDSTAWSTQVSEYPREYLST